MTQTPWVSDASAPSNNVVAIDPSTGAVGTVLSASIVPGLAKGPDALALQPITGDLFLFTAFVANQCGVISQTGQLVSTLPTSNDAGAAAFDAAGQLFIVSDTSLQLHRLDTTTAALLTSVTLQGFSSRASAMAFDPATGHLVVLADATESLVEFDAVTGAQLGSTPLAPFGVGGGLPGLMAFDASGSQLHVAKGFGAAGLFVFDRGTAVTDVCLGDGTGAVCPCGNLGAAGEGCANSTGSGATLGASGTAQVGADSLVLEAAGSPPAVFGVFFGGGAEIAPALFGDGLRCVGGGIQRLGAPLRTDASGLAQSAVTISVIEGLAGAETRHYPFWYRDTAGPCGQGFNVSHAVQLTRQ